MADDKPVNPPAEYDFTLVIITPDGKTVYQVEAKDLPKIAKTGLAQTAGATVNQLVDLSSPIAHNPYPPGHTNEDLLGTFFVNLSAIKPPPRRE